MRRWQVGQSWSGDIGLDNIGQLDNFYPMSESHSPWRPLGSFCLVRRLAVPYFTDEQTICAGHIRHSSHIYLPFKEWAQFGWFSGDHYRWPFMTIIDDLLWAWDDLLWVSHLCQISYESRITVGGRVGWEWRESRVGADLAAYIYPTNCTHTHVKPSSLYLSTAHMHVLHAAYIYPTNCTYKHKNINCREMIFCKTDDLTY